jgi:hypothetical protein
MHHPQNASSCAGAAGSESVASAPSQITLGQTAAVVLSVALAAALAFAVLAALPHQPSQAELAVANLDGRSEVLALGASHVFTGIEPTLTARPWTLLSAGLLNYRFMEAVLAAHEPQLPNLKMVVVDLDPLPVFADSYATSRGDYDHLLDLAPDLSALREPLSHKLALAKDRLLTRQLPIKRAFWRQKLDGERAQKLLRHEGPDHEIVAGHERFIGRRPGAGAWGDRMVGHRAVYAADAIGPNLRAFQRMVEHLRSRGLQLVFVRFPVHPAYLAASPPEFSETFAQLERLARKLAPEATFLDYASATGLSDEDFYDDDHLNQRGAVRFTPVLSTAVEQLLRTSR